MDLIIDDEGDTRLVELKRGKLFRAPPEEADIIAEAFNTEATETDATDAPEADELEMMGDEIARKL